MFITEKDIANQTQDSYVEMIIKGDDESPWEGGLNGKFYRIARNRPVKVPKALARLIILSAQVTVLSEHDIGEYKRGNGKCLNAGGRREAKSK